MSYLRNYQNAAKRAAELELRNNQSTLIVLPTGCGKTETGLSIVDDWDGGVLWLAHREELVFQPWERWKLKTGEQAEMEMGEYTRSPHGSHVTFASKDSLWRDDRLRRAYPDPKSVSLIVIDEGHHAVRLNKTYQRIIDYFSANPDLRILGLTATPDRADEQALGQTFRTVAYEYPLFAPDGSGSAITDGWLVPIMQQYVTIDDVDFDAIGTRGGDFVEAQLAEQMLHERALHGQCAAGLALADGQTTLAFNASIKQAVLQAEIFNRHRPGSAWAVASKIDDDMKLPFVQDSGDKEGRRRLLKQWGSGEFQFNCNVSVFTEGTDEPNIRAILMGRPTKSRSLYAQMAGRGTRVLRNIIEGRNEDGSYWRLNSPDERKAAIAASDKPRVRVIDFVGNSSKHRLMSSIDIMGGLFPDEVLEIAARRAKGKQGPVDRPSCYARPRPRLSTKPKSVAAASSRNAND